VDTERRQSQRLAILGGKPAFSEPLHVGRPNIGDRVAFFHRVEQILNNKWLTNDGPMVREFESRVCGMLGTKHCVAVCNGTVALDIAIRALGMQGEVILPAFTFIATAHALQWQGIIPVFCDIDPHCHHIDPAQVEELITPDTTGIIGVHLWGCPCAITALSDIAQRNSLKLLFDAAHAFGCSYRQQMIGNYGDAEVVSFHATKVLNSFEGGAILTNNDVLADKIRLMRNFGFAGYDKVVYLGTNGKMSEIAAAMGVTNLDRLMDFVDINRNHHETYRALLEELPGLRILACHNDEKHNYQYVVLEIEQERFGISRDLLLRSLHAENIFARRYFYPGAHLMEPYASLYPGSEARLKNTVQVSERVLVLPTGTQLDTSGVELIGDRIRAIQKYASEIVALRTLQ